MKKIYTVIITALFVVCLLLFLKNKQGQSLWDKSNSQPENLLNQVNEENEKKDTQDLNATQSATQKGIGKKLETVTQQVQKSQLVDAGSPVIIVNDFGKEPDKLEFTIGKMSYSRNLKEEYTVSQDVKKRFPADVMGEDGSFLKDFYYLYVDVTVKNVAESVHLYAPNGLDYLPIDSKTGMASDFRRNYKYNGVNIYPTPYYFRETDGRDLISYMKFIKYFKPGEECSYEACYVVSEELREAELYLRYSFGKTPPERAFSDTNQRYIKVEVGKD